MNLTKKQIQWLMLASNRVNAAKDIGVLVSNKDYAYCTDGFGLHYIENNKTKLYHLNHDVTELVYNAYISNYLPLNSAMKKAVNVFDKYVTVKGVNEFSDDVLTISERKMYDNFWSPVTVNKKLLSNALKHIGAPHIATEKNNILHVAGRIDNRVCHAVIMGIRKEKE